MMVRCVILAASLATASCFAPPASPLLRGGKSSHSLPAEGMWSRSLLTQSTGRTATMLWNPFAGNGNEEKRAAVRSNLVQLCKSGPKNGVGASEELQASITKACRELAALNPTKSQARSDLLTGEWGLLYTSTTGASAGKLGPFVGEVLQRIDMAAGKYDNVVILGGGVVEAVLSARWEVPSPETWRVLFEDIKFKVLGLKVIDRSFSRVSRDQVLDTLDSLATGKAESNPQNSGTWEMTYTDPTLRVLYAQGSDPAKPPNVYILAKEG
mmetsp:Transcript_43348/g.84663  ORF Transcript_43348/g.84663 Transcript_43348/m.84663 type:complete len:269 (+) Transcript_43348:58-864(+)|eukprot:CAMPEP_0173382864 /NCGR_PEP_ID=MMETSP1356-20130122/5383_1 /TAXON_ID=77927 ORGANISM="Hemiselmis virescens, Strain PCC157" /NCGR_SAMPLE_ID=MMETSP1356 /ASSEMBLY_ACC=CAM_ASM_000847 /LENGTH=268 /DNA_ID=CAMNT_0014337433 /DNA_START=36 /DNA_END=842 /DNA_ORIENTATION=-